MYKKCTSNSCIHTKNVQTVQNLYKVQTKNDLKLEIYVFCTQKLMKTTQNLYNQLTEMAFVCFFLHTNNVQIIQILYNQLTETAFLCFLHIQIMYKLHKMYTNVNQIIYAAADVCFMYTKPLHSLLFEFFASITTPSSVLKFQDRSFHTQKDSQMNLFRFIQY